ncbi:MAG: acyl-CoA dehydrogenase family protein, partial [Chloroflexi bacterium]|nr:acyl-CoA dehydrogenase family protein [Chloroflexota bacterium]
MDFGWSQAQVALRQEVRQFLAKRLTPDVAEELAHGGNHTANDPVAIDRRGRGSHVTRLYQEIEDRGWLGMSWPKEYGGQGKDRLSQYIVEEEFARAGIGVGGAGSGAPAVMAVGTEEQKREFIPKLLKGEYTFALGFTEPSGGADLASLQCRAVEDGDYFVVNGQKIFTSAAHAATHMYLMCRTDPDAPKHRGISILI